MLQVKTNGLGRSMTFHLICSVMKIFPALWLYGAAADSSSGKAARISYLIGPNGEVRKAYTTVKVGAHPEEVLSDLVDHSCRIR